MKKQDLKGNSVICAFPWEMYSVDAGFGWWRPCPRIDYQKLNDHNFNNHERLIELRQNLRKGKKDSLCYKCWTDEENGVKSYRQVLKQDRVHPLAHLDKIEAPKILEIKFHNHCNLKCVFCSSNCSSLWEKELPIEEKQKGLIRGAQVRKNLIGHFIKNYEKIPVIQIFGGEPVLHKEFFDIVDILSKGKKSGGTKTLSFSTNLMFPPLLMGKFENAMEKVVESGHKLYLRVSIDGIGKRGEYLREGLDWQLFEKNLLSFRNRFASTPELGRVRCNIALNILNLTYLSEIMEYLKDQKLDWIEPHYNYVGKPDIFMMQTYGSRLQIPLERIKEQNFHSYQKYKDHVISLVHSMEHLNPNLQVIEQCREWLKAYDEKTGASFEEIFPDNTYMFESV